MSIHARRVVRRDFLRGAGAVALAAAGLSLLPGCRAVAPVSGSKRSGKTPVIGYLGLHALDRGNVSPASQRLFGVPNADSLRQGLLDLGYVDGKTIRIEYRFAGDDQRRLQESALELVRMKVDVLVADDTLALQAASQATHTLPIVSTFSGDPIATGLVANLARPGGNVTGPSDLSLELAGKRLEILNGAVPGIRNVGVYWNPALPDLQLTFQHTQEAAQSLGVQLTSLEVRAFDDFATAFEAARASRIDAFVLLTDSVINSGGANLALFQNAYRLPGASDGPGWLASGGFMSYGIDSDDLFRRVAGYVDRILKGARPAELPIDRAARFALVFNQRIAAALGITIPEPLLVQANDVLR
jgi:putative ABC transport system substrate-binding protein